MHETPTTVTWSEPLKIYCRVIVTQILVGKRKNFVIDLADFGTQTKKGCPPLSYTVAGMYW